LRTLIEEGQHQQSVCDDPHCDLLVDLTDWCIDLPTRGD
jgi:hypothetical protein